MPHLGDEKLNKILVRDFNRYTYGRWRQPFKSGDLPHNFESCFWEPLHYSNWPRFWDYVKHSACHWLVNFNLRLVTLAEPKRRWRILTSDLHSTVWDGRNTLFDLNFLALGVSPEECWDLATSMEHGAMEMPIGKEIRTYLTTYYKLE